MQILYPTYSLCKECAITIFLLLPKHLISFPHLSMGNICCQTDPEQNPADIIDLDLYEEVHKLQIDDFLKKWFEEHQQVQKQQNQNSPKLMKHLDFDRYYYGTFSKNHPQGKGFLYQPGHLFYEGSFKDGLATGHSTIKYLDTNIEFEGEMKRGKADGDGTIDNLQEKYRFKGVWKDSKPEKGILTLLNDPNIVFVDFQSFQEGKGIISYKDNRKYTGQIDCSRILPHGKGVVTFSAGSPKISYEGDWVDGQMHGKGKLFWTDGSSYEGDYVKGKKEGFGKFIFSQKKIFEGFWLNGKQDGTGIVFDVNGQELKRGLWKEGSFERSLERAEFEDQNQKYSKKFSKSEKKVEEEGEEEEGEEEEEEKKSQVEKQFSFGVKKGRNQEEGDGLPHSQKKQEEKQS